MSYVRSSLWVVFGWGVVIFVTCVLLAYIFAEPQLNTFAHTFVDVLDGFFLPLQIFGWTFCICLSLATIVALGFCGLLAYRKLLDIQERRYNWGMVVLPEGSAVAHRELDYHVSANPRAVAGRVTVNEVANPALELSTPSVPQAPPFKYAREHMRDGRVVLGYTVDGPVYGTLDNLLSTGIVGLPGYGKSMTLRYMVAIALLFRAAVVGWDPHASIAEEYGDLLHIVDTPEAIVSS